MCSVHIIDADVFDYNGPLMSNVVHLHWLPELKITVNNSIHEHTVTFSLHIEIRETSVWSIWNLNECVQHKLGTDDIMGNGSVVAVICWMENVFNTLHITAAVSTDR